MAVICFLGASTSWIPTVVTDLASVFDEPLEFRVIDLNSEAAALGVALGEAIAKGQGRKDRFQAFTDRRAALRGADAVLITLSVGGLASMEQDLTLSEKWGIYATVGDTTGPAVWARALRHIPVFTEFAHDFQVLCPRAFIVNYSNPMAALTATLQLECGNPVLGLCHSDFETKDFIQLALDLESWDPISLSFAGMNHFTWVVDFRVGREDGYRLLREKIGNGSLRDLVAGKPSYRGRFYASDLAFELFTHYGYLPYPGDRHICEFVSYTLSGAPERYTQQEDDLEVDTVRYCNLKRTSMESRRRWMAQREKFVRQWIAGEKEMPQRSRETGADMVRAYLHNKPFTDAVNVLNVGQIPGLPPGCCVETMGVVDGMGVRPMVVENIAEPLLEIMRPQAMCQKWITQGARERNKDLLFQALHRDPQCAGLKPHEVAAMGEELLAANRAYFAL